MAEPFATSAADRLYASVKADLRSFLQYVNDADFAAADTVMEAPRAAIALARAASAEDALLSDLYVLNKYLALLSSYGRTWRLILEGEFAPSWGALQDTLDSLRLVKRFSAVDVT